jgi:hypothetical protein
MMTPTHCDKSLLKEITLRTMEKQLLQGRRYASAISINIIACLGCSCHIWVPQLVYFDKIHHYVLKKLILLFPFSHFSQMRKSTQNTL